MSCGGSAARNRNAAAIRDALASHPGALTVEQARAVFHRLSDARRAELAAGRRTADGPSPDRGQARELTQEAHAYARSRLDSEIAAVARAHAANEPNTRVLAADAAEWTANDPDTAALLTPATAAAEVRRERRAAVADAFTSRHADGEAEERAAAATDDRPVDPGWGDASRWLARAADRRAARCQDPDEKAKWTALTGRLERVARLQQAFGSAEVHAPENWETVVDHDRPYGPGLQARWDALSDTERDVMRLRKGKPAPSGEAPRPHTLDQAAAVLGVTAERVRQIESKARRKLQQAPRS